MTPEGDDITFTQCTALWGSSELQVRCQEGIGVFLAGWEFMGLLLSTLMSLSLLGLKKTLFVRCGQE